ncbi:type VI secretion system tube protein TssD, partial [Flavobacterium sp. PL002]
MSFLTSLTVAGKDYKVLNVSYDLAQETDASGRPSTVTRGGRVMIEVESTGG